MGKREQERLEIDDDAVIVNRLLAELRRSRAGPQIIARIPVQRPRPQTPGKRPRPKTPVQRPQAKTPVQRHHPKTPRRTVLRHEVRLSSTRAWSAHGQQRGVGYDIRAVGKIGRLLIGGALVLGPAWVMLTDTSWWFKVQIVLSFAAIFAIYWAAYRVLGEFVLRRMSPWVGTILLVAIPTAIIVAPAPGLPMPVRLGVLLYVGVGLLVNVFANYGGCEVLALQSLIYGRWYKVYCPINVLDAVEDTVVGIDVLPSRPGS